MNPAAVSCGIWPGAPGPRWLPGCNRYTGMSQQGDAQETVHVHACATGPGGEGAAAVWESSMFSILLISPRTGLALHLKLASNAYPSCLCLPSAKITRTSHHQAFPQL